MSEVLEQRREKVLDFIKKKPYVIATVLFAVIVYFGAFIRTRNLSMLKDVMTNEYIPLALDPYVFLRYVQYVAEHGQLMVVDTMRYYPLGYTGVNEFKILSFAIVYLYKFIHIFVPSITLEYVHVIYPVVAFCIGLVFFFLLLYKVSNWKVALVSSAFLAVLPAYLYRTMAGFSDKEAFAIMLIYLGLFLFISFILEKEMKWKVLYTIGAGIAVALSYLVWGGGGFVILTLGLFVIVLVLLGRLEEKTMYLYLLFIVIFFGLYMFVFPERASLSMLLTSYFTGSLIFALIYGLVNFFLFKKDVFKIKEKVNFPYPFVSGAIVLVLGFIALLVTQGFSYLKTRVADMITLLTAPQTFDRWALTVAESHQPYFVDWVGQFTWLYLVLVFVGAVLLFYETFKSFKKESYYLSGAFGVFIIGFTMSRYSSGASIFNGASQTSIYVYLGSVILFLLFFAYVVYTKYMDEEHRKEIFSQINIGYLIILIFFFFTLLGARSAVRLLFTFAPATAMLAGFGVVLVGAYIWKLKDKYLKYALVIVLIFLVLSSLNGFAQTSLNQGKYTGPSYNQQWQVAMEWVRTSTPDDAVFAHWWDYGYWVQTGGERATLSDGGNARGAINHFIGRHLLTGHSEVEALELLKANNATHVLMISDEIGKYGAYSSIGADANYDRYSWIPTFKLDLEQTQETRNGTDFVYTGGTPLDEDLIYDGQLYPKGSAAVIGVILPATTNASSGLIEEFSEPVAVITLNGGLTRVPLKCIYFQGEEYVYDVEGLDGCLMIIPLIKDNQMNDIGGALYLSPRVYPTTFTHLYLFGEEWEYFNLVYNDEKSIPLAVYDWRVAGPLKIWEVSYPDNLTIPEEYYGTLVLLDTCFIFYLFDHGGELLEGFNYGLSSFTVEELLKVGHRLHKMKVPLRRFLKKYNFVVIDTPVSPGDFKGEKDFVNSVDKDLLKHIADPSDAVLLAVAIKTHSIVLTKDKHHLFTVDLENYLRKYNLKVYKELKDLKGIDT